ncbi:hypothetical protein FOL47_008843 [Perkinsus chesapeaki]|uniref:Uncharacterized protein n=1 Tax=Perkinsus chesapeaki TaxID=330153 RepID=A0A7J6LBH2_PERCH|nr:hypothetical protein FOL47_008843 [Perkinsus chesapeaki]
MSTCIGSDPRQSSSSMEPHLTHTALSATPLRLPSHPASPDECMDANESTHHHKVHPVGEPLSPTSYAKAMANDTILGELSVGSCTTLNCGRGCWFAYSSRGCREGAACDRCHHSACAIPADEQRRRNRKEKSRQRPSKKKRSKALAQKLAAMDHDDEEDNSDDEGNEERGEDNGVNKTNSSSHVVAVQKSLLGTPSPSPCLAHKDDDVNCPDCVTMRPTTTIKILPECLATTSTARLLSSNNKKNSSIVSSEESCRSFTHRPAVLSSSSIGSVSSPASAQSTATGGSSTARSSPTKYGLNASPLFDASSPFTYLPDRSQQQGHQQQQPLYGTPFGMCYAEAASDSMGYDMTVPTPVITSKNDQLPCEFQGWSGLVDALEKMFALNPSSSSSSTAWGC